MRGLAFSMVLVFTVIGSPVSNAMFASPETEQVPIDRIFINLQKRFSANTNDFELNYSLARLHSMAYSTNLASLSVVKKSGLPMFSYPGSDRYVPETVTSQVSSAARENARIHLTNAIQFYERSIFLLKSSMVTNEAARKWMVTPTQLGLAWCLAEAGRTNDALVAYRKALKVAWHQEVVGDFEFKQWLNDAWGDVRSGQNPLRTHANGYIGPGICMSQEIIGYMLSLLDPVKDAAEIVDLKSRSTRLATMGRAVTPLLIPLVDHVELKDLVDCRARVRFDLDGSGIRREWAWPTSKAGWLVYDSKNSRNITSGLQLFGNVTFWIFWQDGYHALAALDDNGDGSISGNELKGLAVWNDRNCNGISEPEEVLPVESLGIRSISCTGQLDGDGMPWNPQGVVFTNGTVRATYDWIVPSAEVSQPKLDVAD